MTTPDNESGNSAGAAAAADTEYPVAAASSNRRVYRRRAEDCTTEELCEAHQEKLDTLVAEFSAQIEMHLAYERRLENEIARMRLAMCAARFISEVPS